MAATTKEHQPTNTAESSRKDGYAPKITATFDDGDDDVRLRLLPSGQDGSGQYCFLKRDELAEFCRDYLRLHKERD